MRRQARGLVILGVLFLVGCGQQPVATGPAGTAGPAGSSGPVGSSGESGAVPSEDPAVTPGSTELPPASLTDPHEIGVALRDPERVDVAVASGVALLGIGVYGADGAAVRPGRGTGLHDMWLTVEELRGLVEMARDDLALIAAADAAAPRLGDLTEAIAPLVPGLTSDAILAAFRDAYGPGGGVVGGMLAGIAWEAGTAVTRAELWFLLVDAFVLPATTAAVPLQLAAAGGALPPLRPVTAVGGLPIIPTGDPRLDVAAYNMLIAHMSVVGYQIPFEIQPASARAHEGHGGAGQAVTFSARHLPYQDPLVSPNGVPLLLPSGRGLDGLPIDWATSGPMDDHGTFDRTIGSPQLTDASGTAKLVYTPQEEPANGQGTEKADNGQVTASVSLAALVTQHFLVPPGLAAFAFGRRNLPAHVLLQWHENLALELEIDSTITIQKAAGLPVNNGVAHVTGHIRLERNDADGTWHGIGTLTNTVTSGPPPCNGNSISGGRPYDWLVRQVVARPGIAPDKLEVWMDSGPIVELDGTGPDTGVTRYCPGGTFPFTLDTWENFFFGVHRADYGAMGFHVVGWAAGPGIADWVPGQEIAHVTWTSACANSSVDVFVKITDCQATTEFRINAVR